VREDLPLGGRDGRLDRVMAIEVIGRDVEHDRDRGPERLGRLELERRHLEHRDVERQADERERGRADVAGHRRAQPRRAQHLRDERGRGRLPVRARHGDDRHRERGDRELDVAAHARARER
jgi:hypothetical protein